MNRLIFSKYLIPLVLLATLTASAKEPKETGYQMQRFSALNRLPLRPTTLTAQPMRL